MRCGAAASTTASRDLAGCSGSFDRVLCTQRMIPTDATSRSGQAQRLKALPSPLAGEGLTVLQHALKGERVASQKILSKCPPHPFYFIAAPSCPPPRGGRANAAPACSRLDY